MANDQIIVNYTYYYYIFLDNDIRVGVNYRKIAEEIKCSYQLYVYSYQRSREKSIFIFIDVYLH